MKPPQCGSCMNCTDHFFGRSGGGSSCTKGCSNWKVNRGRESGPCRSDGSRGGEGSRAAPCHGRGRRRRAHWRGLRIQMNRMLFSLNPRTRLFPFVIYEVCPYKSQIKSIRILPRLLLCPATMKIWNS